MEISKLPLKLTVLDGWLHEDAHGDGKPFDVVTRVDGRQFSEFWLRTVTGFGEYNGLEQV